MLAFVTLLTLQFTLFTFLMTLLTYLTSFETLGSQFTLHLTHITLLTFLQMTHLALAISGRLYHIRIFRIIGFDLNIFVVIGAEARFLTLSFLNNHIILIAAACNGEFNRGNLRHSVRCICVFPSLGKSGDIVGKLFDAWLLLECDEAI